ncbi:hypothetical protein F7Q99_21475 [Streptomyces kaniharaensis]|uniref:DoxX family membrane protein n=1 Tax=Streptomyces kaniharaensis TaxID=212423 RepID=A0A6N7KTJ5_9ACTN|nr:hypothetical protein [Streptomyces kaniharaensis]MQS14761.1 hypothetical protein [Streptomyces kaniharaensis]
MNRIAAVSLGIFLSGVGAAHFVVPGYFRTLVPRWLTQPALLVAAAGAAEIAVGALVLTPRWRAAGGWAAAALITIYLVSHVDALRSARADRTRFLEQPVGAAARLVVNLFYICWSIAVAEAAA